MTYTFKLARRLAILRELAMLTALALLVACTGETTGPEAASPTPPATPIAFRVVPDVVTIQTKQRIRFRGEGQTSRGVRYFQPVSWKSTGGSIDADGNFSAAKPGTYRILGWRRGRSVPDTSIVIVVPWPGNVTRVEITPDSVAVASNGTYGFKAVARLASGGTAPIGVVWSATGGSIDPSGKYRARSEAGTFRVVARNVGGKLADTAEVVITPSESSAPTPEPEPEPAPGPGIPGPTPEPDSTPAPPPPALAGVFLTPTTVSLATASTRQFVAFGRNSAGDSVGVSASFRATGGTITPGGLYTAGTTAGTFRVIATVSGLSDTATVTLRRTLGSGGGAGGVPFGTFSSWEGNTLKPGTEPFTLGHAANTASTIIPRIEAARREGVKLVLAMTGGAHANYMTNGVFDRDKWLAKQNTYDTPAIREAIAKAVADGTVIGASVMDEPNVHGKGDGGTWGPKGTLTKARVDSLCRVVKDMFPTLPVGVSHKHDMFEPEKSYRHCEFLMDQYAHRVGDPVAFRNAALALARRDNMKILFSLNILSGGIQAARDGTWNCPLGLTGGRGTFDPTCRMTPAQIREWGILFGSSGCALMMWRYDERFVTNPANQQAFRDVRNHLATLPRQSCGRD